MALPRVQPPDELLNVTVVACKVTLLVVTVLPVVVAKKIIVPPVAVNATPVAAFNQEPKQLITPVPAKARVTFPTAGPAMVMSCATALVPTVTVYNVAFDEESKMTSSADVGGPAPPAPPEVKDQLLVFVAFHASAVRLRQ